MPSIEKESQSFGPGGASEPLIPLSPDSPSTPTTDPLPPLSPTQYYFYVVLTIITIVSGACLGLLPLTLFSFCRFFTKEEGYVCAGMMLSSLQWSAAVAFPVWILHGVLQKAWYARFKKQSGYQ